MSYGRIHATEVHGHTVNQQTDQRLHRETTTFLARTSSSDVDGHKGADRVDLPPCGSLHDHDEDVTGAGTPTTWEKESCVQVSERETTLLDERTGKILRSVAGFRAAPG